MMEEVLGGPSTIMLAVILGPVIQNKIIGAESSGKQTYESRKDAKGEQEKFQRC